jgi:hypothetical protein
MTIQKMALTLTLAFLFPAGLASLPTPSGHDVYAAISGWLGPTVAEAQNAETTDDIVEIEAEGMGITRVEAQNAAITEAVKMGVGMFLVSKTEVINDDISEQIISYSRGKIVSYKELASANVDGIWRVKVLVLMRRDLLANSAASLTQKSVDVQSSDWAALEANKAQSLKSADNLIDFYFTNNDLKNIYQVEEVIPSVNNAGKIVVKVVIGFNNPLLEQLTKNFLDLTEQIAINKTQGVFSNFYIDLHQELEQNGAYLQHEQIYTINNANNAIVNPINTKSYTAYNIEANKFNEISRYLLDSETNQLVNHFKVVAEAFKGSDIVDKANKEIRILKPVTFIYNNDIIYINKLFRVQESPIYSFYEHNVYKKLVLELEFPNLTGTDLQYLTDIQARISIT